MKLSYNLKLSQSLKLTPLLQQSLKFLQASQAELDELLEEYLNDNIFLEREENDTRIKLSATSSQSKNNSMNSDDEYYNIFENQSKNQTLREYLIENLGIFSFSERQQIIFSFLIDAINDEGYLTETFESLIDSIPQQPKADIKELEALIKLIENSSFPGIGARDLSECLYSQLNIIENENEIIKIAKSIVIDHLNLLANKNYEDLVKKINCSRDNLDKAIKVIKTLNPKPGLAFKKINENDYIRPDVTIINENGSWEVYLNEDELFKLRLNNKYEESFKDIPQDSISDLKEKLQEAKWLIKNLQQRAITIIRVSRAIMEHQKDFLEKGELFLSPLILKKISEELDLHESTISRVTSNKFILTPHGIYELKHFFGSKIHSGPGKTLSSKAISGRIKDMTDNEDSQKPYSDEKIVLMLKEQGIKIARRTVAKYRDKLQILPSNQRKK
ncbi:MAG: RNA polymerase factor sigma-54 [Methylophilaceae bacterium]|jgi:RNA polymerase sigma-54 factor|nr:RNA polymerase factor sigma-54 [Methylophilaceae bacterium]